MLAVIEQGAKQYLVKVGDIIKVEKVAEAVGDRVTITSPLAILTPEETATKSEQGRKVVAQVLEHKKADKVLIFKKKRRHNYRRKLGHRQEISVLKVVEIS